MAGRNSYFRSIPLLLLLGWLFITSFFVPFRDKADEWMPLLSGFVDPELFFGNRLLLVAGGILSVCLLLLPVYFINSKSPGKSFRMYYTMTFCLLIILSNPMSVYFSTIYPAAILIAWGQYCFIVKQRFTAFFLLAFASLFYAPLIWVIPLVLIISLAGAPDVPRKFAKSLAGILLPYIYIFSFRYIYFDDIEEFVKQYFNEIIRIDIPVYSLSFTVIFMFICFFIMALHAVLNIFGRLGRQNIFTGRILKIELLAAFLCSGVFFLFWGEKSLPLCVILAPPLSLLLSNFFSRNKTGRSAKIELVLLMAAVAVARIAYFVN